jgi:poly(3-hydroxybutyrate) depolymerase
MLVGAGCHGRPQPVEVRVLPASPDASVLTAAFHPALPLARPHLLSRTVAVGGLTRHYILVVPAHVEPGHAYALVLYFHGDGGDGEGMQRNAPFETASGDAALVAYPDGINRTWDLETQRDNRDVAFVEALIADVGRDFSVDRARVFATGYSNGGFFANVLACQRSSMLRAIASAERVSEVSGRGAGGGDRAARRERQRSDARQRAVHGGVLGVRERLQHGGDGDDGVPGMPGVPGVPA